MCAVSLFVSSLYSCLSRKKRLTLSQLIGEYLAKNVDVSRTLCACPRRPLLKDEERALYTTTFHDLKNFTVRLSNKPFLIWFSTTPLYVRYAATLPCNFVNRLFSELMISQSSVATCATSGWIINNQFTANVPGNLQ